ncbi:MAG: thiamine diphosphokinase [Anaerolineae bacterium]
MTEPGAGARTPHIAVVANGEFAHPQRLLAVLAGVDQVIAADGGANWLAAQGITPDVLVGDMDSITPRVALALADGRCRLVRRPSHKDETDTELALLEAVSAGARRITLLGALGGRVDHALANVLLLTMPALEGIEVTLFDGCSSLSLIRNAREIAGRPGDVISLIPLGGAAEGILTEELEYPLVRETLWVGPARGVSNVMLGERARVSLERGLLLLVHTPAAYLHEGEELDEQSL